MNLESTLLSALGWGYLDAEKLCELLEDASEYGFEAEDIRDALKDYSDNPFDINGWIYETLHSTGYGFCKEALEFAEEKYPRVVSHFDIEAKIEDFQDNLSPFCNCLDSFHNNILDEYDLTDKEVSFKLFIKYLINS